MLLKAITRIVALLILVTSLVACSTQTAPDVRFTLLDGKNVDLAKLRGKVVFVNFWATTCTSCVAEMPQLAETYTKFAPKGFELVAVAMNYDPPEYVRNYTAKNALPFPVALDSSGAAAQGFKDVRLTPTSFLIDKQGRIVEQYLGAPDFPKFHALLEKLLAEPA